MRKHAVSLLILCSVNAAAVEFPEVRGTIYNAAKADLTRLEITVSVSCDDPKTGNCGKASVAAKIDAANSGFVIPAVTLNPMGMSGRYEGYFKDGWGKRFDYEVSVTGLGDKLVFHDLGFWSWEARPGNTLKAMLEEIPAELKELTLYASTEPSTIELKPTAKFAGKFLRLRLQKQFLPVAMLGTPDVAKGWMELDLTKTITEKPTVTFSLPPTAFLVRGPLKKYGEIPNTRTVIHAYARHSEKKYKLVGIADETAPFHGKGFFAGAITPVESGEEKLLDALNEKLRASVRH